jgi:putative sigma-54 modulation protein
LSDGEGFSGEKGEYIDIDERRSIHMQYNTRGENIEVTPALRDYVEKKIGRLERYFENTSFSCNVTLRVLRGEHTVEVTIPMPGVILRAEDTNSDMYAAIDLVVEKLERQIRKHKTKVNRKYRQQGAAVFVDAEPVFTSKDEPSEEDSIEIVRTKRFNLKPMDAEEAVLQMDMLGHNFFVFSNADTEEVNVVYRRKDGRYGLIEPENV